MIIEERICDTCYKPMNEGYCINGGEEYYCSDECLYKVYTKEEWDEICSGNDDSYWTEWD